jgi:aspartate kinase
MGKTTDQLLGLARSVTGEPPRRELDMLLSTGERISMALLAMALEARGLSAISFTGSQSGILTNDRHSGARIIEVRPVRIEDELERGKVVIVAGFQGMSYKREITTLGRGGSDTTAVALAAALGADCEIYSDVDGVYSADPRVVTDAHRLDRLGYEEMQELAEHGAKVLNAQAVEWARRHGVVILARATAGSTAETRVDGETGARALAVTGTRRVTRVSGGAAVLAVLDEERVALRHVCERCVRFVRDDLPDWPRTERRLREAGAAIDEEGEVTIVGPGAGSDATLVRRALAAAERALAEQPTTLAAQPMALAAGAEPTPASPPAPVAAPAQAAVVQQPQVALSYDCSPLRLTVRVPSEHVDAVTRALHAALCLPTG